jgi:predicted nucleotidyltransferase
VNDLDFVYDVVQMLGARGVKVWVFGGWAEQLVGLVPPRRHADVDLLYPAESFDELDALELPWLSGTRVPHKRAFAHDGVMVELFLVKRDDLGFYTELPGGTLRWPRDVLSGVHGLRVVGPDALARYRAAYAA